MRVRNKGQLGITLLEALVSAGLLSLVIFLSLKSISTLLENYSELDRKKASAISFVYNQTDCTETFSAKGGACVDLEEIDLKTSDGRNLSLDSVDFPLRSKCLNQDIFVEFLNKDTNTYESLTKIPLACGGDCYNEQVVNQSITFPRIPPMCNWHYNFSTQRTSFQAKFWAYKRQRVVLNVPTGATVCGIEMKSRSTGIRFDDYVLISYADHLIASTALTDAILVNDYGLPRSNGMIRVSLADLESMKGKGPYGGGYLSETATYCHSDAERCIFPRTQTFGPVDINVGNTFFANFLSNPPAQHSLEFTVTGDNDDTDCTHSGFDLDVTIRYSP